MEQLVEFLKFETTPSEKHLGIATVKLYGKIIVKYKICKTKDGASFFSTVASYKMNNDGEDGYVPCIMVDSRYEEEQIKDAIRAGVKATMALQSECPF